MEDLNAYMAKDEEEFKFLNGKETDDVELPEQPTEVEMEFISEAEAEQNFNVVVDASVRRSRRIPPTLDDLLDEENSKVCIDCF